MAAHRPSVFLIQTAPRVHSCLLAPEAPSHVCGPLPPRLGNPPERTFRGTPISNLAAGPIPPSINKYLYKMFCAFKGRKFRVAILEHAKMVSHSVHSGALENSYSFGHFSPCLNNGK